ncbi:MAG: CDP-glycerol glycerophosphotransferase family protein [Tetragenococcus koreensis]|nr:CDP-glycerol glycerophosphotransferase family protein [Tetragenococcus koreensis]MDN6599884.1 CDP-glycerol glycerophosphotransferase family protein [Tetragenococcus koreensis]
MEKLNFFVEHENFIIVTEKTDFSKLRVSKHDENEYFEKVSSNTWKISGNQLQSLCNIKDSKRLFLYFGNNQQEIDASKFEISFGQSTTLSFNNHVFYGYISLDNKIRFITQKPTAKSYYIDSVPLEIKSLDSSIELTLNIKTKYVPLSETNLVIYNRQEKNKLKVLSTKVTSKMAEPNIYQNICSFYFSSNHFLKNLRPSFNFNEFDTTLFDFYFTIGIKQTPLSNYEFRISFSEIIDTELWCNYPNEKKCLFYFYKTVYGNLSARIGIIKKEVYHTYHSLLLQSGKKDANKIVLICEYPYKAQDNGFIFFQYLIEKQTNFTPYYIVTEDSKDLPNLKPYMDHVVYYKSKEHLQLLFKANYLMHSHTSNYVLPFYTKRLEAQKNDMKKIFLQHGITASKNIEQHYGKQTHPNMTDKILVSSERELEQVHEQLQYPFNEIEITGLARFDHLLKNNHFTKTRQLRKKVLIMPTWRSGEDKLTDEDFMQTKFFRYFSDLITDPTIEKLVKDRKITINFYLHNNFQKYRHLFKSDYVTLLKEGEQTVQSLLKEHGILITDFSSVGLDFVLQRRKVLYFQFDSDQEDFQNGQYYLPKLPGPIFKTKQHLLEGLNEAIEDNQLDEPYLEIAKTQLYSYNDTFACKRIYEVLKNL